MIGLAESGAEYEKRGYTPERQAQLGTRFKRFGMPFASKHAPGCPARDAPAAPWSRPAWTRSRRPRSRVRALRFGWFTTNLQMDEDDAIAEALSFAPELDVDAIMSRIDSPEVEEAYQRDRAEARSAAGSAASLQGKTANTDGAERFTAPSLIFEYGDQRLVAGGWQPLAAYDVIVANLDPSFSCRPAPADPGELLRELPYGLTTREISLAMSERNDEPDDDATIRVAERAGGQRSAERTELGDDALWRPAAARVARRRLTGAALHYHRRMPRRLTAPFRHRGDHVRRAGARACHARLPDRRGQELHLGGERRRQRSQAADRRSAAAPLPDGQTITFVAEHQRRQSRAARDAGDRRRRRVTIMTRWRYGVFAWSANSRYIAAQGGPLNGKQKLVLIDLTAGTSRTVATGFFSGASFSPASDQLVYSQVASDRTVFPKANLEIAPVAGGPSHALTSDGHSLYPVWGPSQIAYVRYTKPTGRHRHDDGPKYNLWLIAPDGSGRRQLTHDRVPFLLSGLTPTAWSADGTRLLAEFGGQDTAYAVTVNPTSGRERVVGKASQGIVGTGLSRDGSTILGYTGGAAEDPDLENVITARYIGGAPKVVKRHAFSPDWNR